MVPVHFSADSGKDGSRSLTGLHVILLLPKICGINGILYAQPIADVFAAVITIFMAWQLHRELRVTEEQISHDK